MQIPVPSPPSSAYLLPLVIWLICGALPFVKVKQFGLRKTLRYGALALMGVAPLTLPYLYIVRDNSVELAKGRIYVKAGYFYDILRSVDDFNVDAAAAGPLRQIPQARLATRVNGIGARGYSAGHFSLLAGGMAFVMITDPTRVVYLPARVGPSLLFSADDPQAVLTLLRQQAARRPASGQGSGSVRVAERRAL